MQLTPRDKRILQVAGVAILLFLIVFLFVLRPEDGEELALPSGPTSTPTGTTGLPGESPGSTPSPTPRETLPPVSLAGSRDPFSIPPGLETAGGSVGPTTTGVPTTTVPPATTVPPTTTQPPVTTTQPPVTTTPPPVTTTNPPVTTTPPPPGGGGEGNERPPNKILIGGHDVKLVSVSSIGKKLDVRVDGRVYTVEPGATFDDNFKLVKIDGRCAKFLFGDQSFELCEK